MPPFKEGPKDYKEVLMGRGQDPKTEAKLREIYRHWFNWLDRAFPSWQELEDTRSLRSDPTFLAFLNENKLTRAPVPLLNHQNNIQPGRKASQKPTEVFQSAFEAKIQREKKAYVDQFDLQKLHELWFVLRGVLSSTSPSTTAKTSS